MTIKTRLQCLAAAAGLAATAATAGDIYVIAHPELTLSAEDAKEVFLGTKQLAGSVKLMPFDNLAARKEYLEKVQKMDVGKYETLWAKKSFREGLNPPAAKMSDLDVIAAVKATKGAVGYVSSPPGGGVTVVGKF